MAAPQLDRARRLAAVIERDGASCVWCGREFDALVVPTTEHLDPRIKGARPGSTTRSQPAGAANSDRGHSWRGSQTSAYAAVGSPEVERIVRALADVDRTIAQRGPDWHSAGCDGPPAGEVDGALVELLPGQEGVRPRPAASARRP